MVDLNFWTDSVRGSLLSLVLALSLGNAAAALGQAPSSLPAVSAPSPAPGARMSAAPSAVNASSSLYTVHEVVLESGTTVVEYATSAGQVFAVAWRGPVVPDLPVWLGAYFKTFKLGAEQTRAAGRRGSSVNMARDGLVLRSSGRMRNFFGYAYVPALIPAGVDIKDVLQ